MPAPSPSDRRSLLTPRGWLVWAGAVLTWGTLLFLYRYLGGLADGEREPFLPTLINEMTGGFAGGLMYFPARVLVRRLPLSTSTWTRRLPVYAAAATAGGIAMTSLMWALRSAIYPIAGLGRYDYGAMPLRYFMEFPVELIVLAGMIFALHAFEKFRDAQARQVRAAELERALAQAQLRTLRLQLQPHFLFNALNTISSTMYRDPAAADDMMAQLAELLRASLRTTQTDEVSLSAELEVLGAYLALVRARFGDKLRVAIRAGDGTHSALVPSMMLQPLVENAVRHGRASVSGEGEIAIAARRDGDRLVVTVEDDGPGAQEGDGQGGFGLSATADRLALLYGDRQQFAAANRPGGGFAVTAVLPYRTSGATP
jgi:two-component system, LytTR family, sensor kinase